MKMLSIQEIIEAFEERGFKVHKFWNQCKPSEQGYYEFTIIKDNTYVGGRYEWRPNLSPDAISTYQRDFINELLERWEKEHDRYCREMLAKGLTEGITNSDPESKQYAKQIINLIYGVNTMTEMLYRRDELRMNAITNKPTIKDVIFNNPATIVFWSDNTKTVVKCQDGDIYDPEKGLAMAICKKFFGNKGNYCNEFNKWMKKYDEQCEINTFEYAMAKFYKHLTDMKLSIPKIEVPLHHPILEKAKGNTPNSMYVRATWEFEVDISDFDPEYVDINGIARDIARNELRDLMLKKEIGADDFKYEITGERY